MSNNDITSAICDMEDIKATIKKKGLQDIPKDNDGTEITLGDCIDDVLDYLLNIEYDYGSLEVQDETKR
tara:strand:+ start:1271 stop:1477 length:207 start_codon:yes stop_codon:yes gene_type:complete